MSIWGTARGLLNSAVPRHLGEDLTLTEHVADDAEEPARVVAVRGVLTHAEELVRLGMTVVSADDSRLTLDTQSVPEWLGRGTLVTNESGQTFEVTEVTDNGEGLTEVTLCRLS